MRKFSGIPEMPPGDQDVIGNQGKNRKHVGSCDTGFYGW
jgi:hypothetical protein